MSAEPVPAESASAERKDDHVRLAAAQYERSPADEPFADVSFVHHALAGIDEDLVDLSVQVLGARWSSPLYINAMTGGTAETGRINRALAIAARETSVALASGSVSIALDDPSVAGTFRVLREENPDGFVLANVGIERSADDARRAVDLLGADALQVHVNAVQETVMPEGRRAFSSWQRSLAAIVASAEVPVVVKEVGFGLSPETLTLIADLGVTGADVAGRGGTDFVRVENARRAAHDYDYLIGWGQSAVACLLEAPERSPQLLASGGVRTPLDVARALALGARAVGVSGTFLRVVLDGGPDALVTRIRQWQEHLRALCALLGAPEPAALARADVIVRGATAEYCRARGVNLAPLAHRSAAVPTDHGGAHGQIHAERSRHDR
ncbi:type 2 isopentenyl-diphosphate Delta-isomerase [Microbacterium sp.]|uniref:type 2 isopentenyl-diphosphate Delta-isomerase n=1 Tax=Microbacterium sp. TaxID=51671 RepID=UPI003C7690CB